MFKWFDKAHGIKYVSLRYFNVAGAIPTGVIGEVHNPNAFNPLFTSTIRKKRLYYDFGDDYDTKDGTCIRDYIHVNDLANAHILAVKYLLAGNQSDVFNLGNGEGFSVKELLKQQELSRS